TYMQEGVAGDIRQLSARERKDPATIADLKWVLDGTPLVSAGASKGSAPLEWRHRHFGLPPNTHWKTTIVGTRRLGLADRLVGIGHRIEYKMFLGDYGQTPIDNHWKSSGER